MRQPMRAWAWLVLGLVACRGPADNMQVVWVRHGDSATVGLPGHAVWCEGPGWMELVAGRNDTGVGLAVFPVEGEFLGRYPVVPVVERSDSLRPVGGIAIRWFSSDELLAFEAREGDITVEGDRTAISGRFRGRLRQVEGDDSLEVSGSFREVPVTRGGIECQQPDSGASDTGAVLD